MKFEQLLKIYWSRNFLYGGKTQSFQVTFFEFFIEKPGLNSKAIFLFLKRFEIQHLFLLKNIDILFSKEFSLEQRKIINIYLSKIISINNTISELKKLIHARLYLIKTFKGRCQALGKPSNGQRTWSNAKTSKICNNELKIFIQEVKKFNFAKLKKEKPSLNKKFIKKNIRIKKPKIKMIFVKKKKNLWF